MKGNAGIFWEMEDEQKIRAALRDLRERHGMSQGDLAQRAGFGSQTDISKLENGKARLTFEKVARIAHALGEPMASILPKGAAIPKEQSSLPPISAIPLANQKVLQDGLRPLPVRGTAQGGAGRVYMLPVESGPVDLTPRPAILANVDDAYALFVFEDSMSPMYKHGWTMWVHPHKPPAPGNGVIVIKKDGEVIVKELVRRTDKAVTLRRYNPTVEEFDISPSEIEAIHLVVGCLQTL